MLATEPCVPCRGDEEAVPVNELPKLLREIPGWQIIEVDGVRRLHRTYSFKNFAGALAFTNEVGRIAEEAQHHPLIITEWGKVTVQWWTHAIKGLHRNDFIMAARTDLLVGV